MDKSHVPRTVFCPILCHLGREYWITSDLPAAYEAAALDVGKSLPS